MSAQVEQESGGVPRRVSMTDVARAAGVSQKTVSRVVNGEAHVRPDVARRVQDAILALGFRPNAAARALVTKRSRRIGVVSIGSLLHGPATVLVGLEEAIREAGYSLALVRTGADSAAEIQAAIDALVDEGVDGIALSEPVDAVGETVHVPHAIPVLSISSPKDHDDPSMIVVGADQRSGARRATEHLLTLGHRTVWHIAGPSQWAPARERILGWRDALRDADAAEPALVAGDWTPASGFTAMHTLLQRPDVTAVFAANDHMAIGAMRAIERAGLKVPGDVSVVGFDDTPESEYLSVPLTTVRQDLGEVAREGVHRLVRAVEGANAGTQRLMPVQLVVRESTTGPNPLRRPIRPV